MTHPHTTEGLTIANLCIDLSQEPVRNAVISLPIFSNEAVMNTNQVEREAGQMVGSREALGVCASKYIDSLIQKRSPVTIATLGTSQINLRNSTMTWLR